MTPASRYLRERSDLLLGLTEFSHAHWFFGNLYEVAAKIPHRVSASEGSPELARTPLGAGSPGRYYAPVAPLIVPTALASLVAGWDRPASRPWLILGAASSVAGTIATGYFLRVLNPPLFFSPEPLNEEIRGPMLKKWYRLHAFRLAASGVALAAFDRARTAALRNG